MFELVENLPKRLLYFKGNFSTLPHHLVRDRSKNKLVNIVFFGTPRFAQIVLERLINFPYKPKLVITAPDAKVGRGQQVGQSPVKQTAIKNRIEVVQPEKLSGSSQGPSFFLESPKSRTDLFANGPFCLEHLDLAILVAYGKIIPKEVLAIPKYGFINVHPSLLPKYRGPSPIQSAILAGEEKTGVTIIKLDEEVDHGPILGQTELKIENDDTHDSLGEKLANLGASLLLEVLPEFLSHFRSVPGINLAHSGSELRAQDHSKATFTKHITKEDGFIDLQNLPDAVTFDRMVRAYYPWPTVWSKLMVNGKWLIVKFLPGGQIQPEGKRPMSIKEFLNGYPQAKELIEKVIKQ